MSPISLALFTGALTLSGLPAIAQGIAPGCDKDLAAVDASFEETQARLQKAARADQTEKCAAIRHHVEVMANGINVFQRCQPEGHDKGENIGQLGASIGDFLDISDRQGCARFELPKIDLPQ